MANLNTIAIDLAGGSAVMTITNSGNPVETITYIDSTKIINFTNRSPITLSATDFLNHLSQYVIFQQAILANFQANIFLTIPFTEVQHLENNNIIGSTWNFYSVIGYSPLGRIVDYTATIANHTVTMNDRPLALTSNFTECVYLLQALNHYFLSLKSYFSL